MQPTSESPCVSSCSGAKPNFIARVRGCVFVTLLLTGGILKGLGADDSTPPSEDEYSFPWEKGSVKFGGFVAAFNSTLGFGLTHGPSVEIKGEDGLGLDSSLTVFRVDALYRPGKSRRHQVDFSYAAYHRDASRTLSEEIDLGEGQILPIGANVSTVFDFDIIRGTYSYAVLQDDRVRLAFGLGLAYSGLSVSVEQDDISSNYPGANFIGNVDVRYSGLLLYGKLSF